MKLIIFFTCLVVAAMAAPKPAEIIQYENEHNINSYNFLFQTSDGTYRSEVGQVNNPGTDDESLAVSGNFQYIGPDGITYTVTYTADENGFRPVGDHLPKTKF